MTIELIRIPDNIRNAMLYYNFYVTKWGRVLLAEYSDALCYVAFVQGSDEDAVTEMRKRLDYACDALMQETPLHAKVLEGMQGIDCSFRVALKATDFQWKVWKTLMQIPYGETRTYAQIATLAAFPKAVRAVATAIGQNVVAYYVPCHRVIRSDGSLGGYRWGTDIKKNILESEKYKIWKKE